MIDGPQMELGCFVGSVLSETQRFASTLKQRDGRFDLFSKINAHFLILIE